MSYTYFVTIKLAVGVGIRISGIGFIRIQPDTRRVLDTQYPILWEWVCDWILKFKISRVLSNPNGYWVLSEYPIYYLKIFLN